MGVSMMAINKMITRIIKLVQKAVCMKEWLQSGTK